MRYFIDCEFDGFRGPLISMALVREDGRSLYFVVDGPAARDAWVIEHVLPIITDCPEAPFSWAPTGAAFGVKQFLAGDEDVHIIADWPDDLRHFCDLIVYAPGEMADIPRFTMELKRVDAWPNDIEGAVQHNAWWDAVALQRKVLELEAAEGKPEPPTLSALRVGQIVHVMGFGIRMIVVAPNAPEYGVGVAWFNESQELQTADFPREVLCLWTESEERVGRGPARSLHKPSSARIDWRIDC